jgi:hypothetical protein
MSKFYNPHRSRNLYEPGTGKPFKISRSKIDLFVEFRSTSTRQSIRC